MDRPAIHLHATLLQINQSGRKVQERGFTAATGSQQNSDLPRSHVQIKALEDRLVRLPELTRPVVMGEALQFQQGLRSRRRDHQRPQHQPPTAPAQTSNAIPIGLSMY